MPGGGSNAPNDIAFSEQLLAHVSLDGGSVSVIQLDDSLPPARRDNARHSSPRLETSAMSGAAPSRTAHTFEKDQDEPGATCSRNFSASVLCGNRRPV
ncbi:hypothetical protein Franean1_2148 [Parafrankia sp. EAN1pec]|nr:hypothetical protein Franean1_2148 [Frankia sp. EAN1pec]